MAGPEVLPLNSSSKRTHSKPRFWRRCRLYFRRFRMAVWLLVLLGLGGLIYLNQVGLPSFIKKPILEKLRSRGLDLQFSRLRWRWIEGIVAEQVRFGGFDSEDGPRLNAREVQVQLDRAALARFQFQVTGLRLRDGAWLGPSRHQRAPRQLVVEKTAHRPRLFADDQWTARGLHCRLRRRNHSALRHDHQRLRHPGVADLPHFRIHCGGSGPAPVAAAGGLLETVQFDGTPELKLDVRGDARDLREFPRAPSPCAPREPKPGWGALRQKPAHQRAAAASNQVSERRSDSRRRRPRPVGRRHQLASAPGLKAGRKRNDPGSRDPFLTAADGWTPGRPAPNLASRPIGSTPLTQPRPPLRRRQPSSRATVQPLGQRRAFSIVADFRRDLEAVRTAPDPAWAWWTNLHLTSCPGTARRRTSRPRTGSQPAGLARALEAPSLVVSNVSCKPHDAGLQATAGWMSLRATWTSGVTTDLDPTRVAPLLPPGAARWLSQFTCAARRARRPNCPWYSPPGPRASRTGCRGPAHPPGQRPVSRSTRSLFRGLSVLAAQSIFFIRICARHLPDLRYTRPEGVLEAEHRANDQTKDFYWRIRSHFDPLALDPLLKDDQRRALALVELSQPPGITAEIWGRAHQPERTGFRGRVLLTNFSFRGESASRLETVVQYTNQVLEFIQPVVERGTQTARADGLRADFNLQRVFLTNGFSTFEPMVIARAIGRHVARAIEPYQFRAPPTARVHGVIPMHGEEGADLRFQIAGEDFHWWRFNVARIEGSVHWTNHQVHLADVQTQFYDGAAAGFANFDFSPGEPTRFEFVVAVTNALLERLMADLSSATNHLEGRLSGALTVTDGHTESWRSVNGYGHVALTNG